MHYPQKTSEPHTSANSAVNPLNKAPSPKAKPPRSLWPHASCLLPVLLTTLCLAQNHYIPGPEGVAYDRYLNELIAYRNHIRKNLDLSIYQREDLQWPHRVYACHFTFMYDSSFYDPKSNKYLINELLDNAQREFGGFDAITLWHAYPRLGVDQRNQFDYYHDMPGGLEALAQLTQKAHDRNVKVFINYNPWDTGTRREGISDELALAEMVAAINADGIFLDTQITASPTLRPTVDSQRPGVAFIPEHHPEVNQLGSCSESWAQWLTDPKPPGLLHLKWIEPKHNQFQVRRWDTSHRREIETAFFNASGMMIWENIFGTCNPWTTADRQQWKRASAILRCFSDLLSSDQWQPFYPTISEGLYSQRWGDETLAVYTLLSVDGYLEDVPLLRLPSRPNIEYYDLWHGQKLRTEPNDNFIYVWGNIERLGAILEVQPDRITKEITALLEQQKQNQPLDENRNFANPIIDPPPIIRTEPAPADQPPAGMVYVPAQKYTMKIGHIHRECGCYPDPSTPKNKWKDFLVSDTRFEQNIQHNIPVEVAAFFIDQTEVTNRQYHEFLQDSGYKPHHSTNFLKHWPNGQMPEQLADYPVIYVDLQDAQAYAQWAQKRLPTEAEWQLAAQGPNQLKWPWGNEFSPENCNTTKKIAPAQSFPTGKSPAGCYNMAGNVWEWTNSLRDDGHTRFSIIRGGSYFKAQGSIWYFDGGPQPCDHHAKFIHMWPGLDRCATLGFRCVKDVKEQLYNEE